MKLLLLVSTVLAAFATNAMAGNAVATPTSPSAPTVVDDWSGSYVGVMGGGTLVQHKMYVVGFATANESFGIPTLGIFGGYNWQSSNLVYGVDGYIRYRFGKHTENGIPLAVTMQTQLGLDGSLRGRIGMNMGAFLPYVAAGVTTTQLRTFWPVGSAERNTTVFGGTVGVGADVKITKNLFVRAEYDFSAYGKKTFSYCVGGCVMEHKLQTHDFLIGVGYKF
jgi:outer membrane immunogenic protein